MSNLIRHICSIDEIIEQNIENLAELFWLLSLLVISFTCVYILKLYKYENKA